MWSGFSGISTALGPFVGGYLIDALSWRWAFLINVPLARRSRSSRRSAGSRRVARPRRPRRFDVTGAALAALALAGITFALIEAPDDGWGSTLVIGAIAHRRRAARVALRAGRAPQGRRRHDAAGAVPQPGLHGAQPLHRRRVRRAQRRELLPRRDCCRTSPGTTRSQTGLATLPATGLMLLLSARSGALATRIGPRWQLTVGPVVAAVGIAPAARGSARTPTTSPTCCPACCSSGSAWSPWWRR